MTMTSQLLMVCRAFAEAKGISQARLSTLIFNDGKRLDAIAGGGDLGTSRFEHAMAWLSAEWPEGAEWPTDVSRPAVLAAEGAH